MPFASIVNGGLQVTTGEEDDGAAMWADGFCAPRFGWIGTALATLDAASAVAGSSGRARNVARSWTASLGTGALAALATTGDVVETATPTTTEARSPVA
jgi:hypothetical protein